MEDSTEITQDQALNAALEIPEDELDRLNIRDQRLARIEEYEEEAVSRPDPLDAMIGFGSADLQRQFEHLSSEILRQMDSHPHDIEGLRELYPDLGVLLKLRNAIETDLDIQSRVAQQQSAGLPRAAKAKGIVFRPVIGEGDLVAKRRMGHA